MWNLKKILWTERQPLHEETYQWYRLNQQPVDDDDEERWWRRRNREGSQSLKKTMVRLQYFLRTWKYFIQYPKAGKSETFPQNHKLVNRVPAMNKMAAGDDSTSQNTTWRTIWNSRSPCSWVTDTQDSILKYATQRLSKQMMKTSIYRYCKNLQQGLTWRTSSEYEKLRVLNTYREIAGFRFKRKTCKSLSRARIPQRTVVA